MACSSSWSGDPPWVPIIKCPKRIVALRQVGYGDICSLATLPDIFDFSGLYNLDAVGLERFDGPWIKRGDLGTCRVSLYLKPLGVSCGLGPEL